MTSAELSEFYYTAMNAQPTEFWNTFESIDAHRNISHVLKQYPDRMIAQDVENLAAGTSAGEMASYLERRAERIEKHGHNHW